MDKLHREIDVLLFDRVNILGLAGPVKAFKFALIAKKWAYGLRFVSVDGQAVQAGGGGLFWADCGGACALQVAQELVVSQHRHGGQRQFAPTLNSPLKGPWGP
jgi:transcriptional regulator GlxA family with amidase domain